MKKYINKGLVALCLLCPILSYGVDINCYLKDNIVYHGKIDDVYFDDNYIILFVYKENMAYYIKGHCLI